MREIFKGRRYRVSQDDNGGVTLESTPALSRHFGAGAEANAFLGELTKHNAPGDPIGSMSKADGWLATQVQPSRRYRVYCGEAYSVRAQLTQEADKRNRASTILADCKVPLGEDFHRLSSSQVEALLEEAKAQRYRQPRNANGSRARYFHDLLQRRAR